MLNGTISESNIGRLVNLKEMKLKDNRLSGVIPSAISKLSNLEYCESITMHAVYLKPNSHGIILVNVHSNNLRGMIPSGIFLLPLLELVDISFNRLTGGIPNEFITSNSMKTCEYPLLQLLNFY